MQMEAARNTRRELHALARRRTCRWQDGSRHGFSQCCGGVNSALCEARDDHS